MNIHKIIKNTALQNQKLDLPKPVLFNSVILSQNIGFDIDDRRCISVGDT